MKKINSIGYGGRILGAAVLFAVVIPGALRLLLLVFEHPPLVLCAKISLGIGLTLILALSVLLAIEFHQDKRQNRYYEARRNVKLSLGNGLYECQSCGNNAVKHNEKSCGICGIIFEEMGEQNEKNK